MLSLLLLSSFFAGASKLWNGRPPARPHSAGWRHIGFIYHSSAGPRPLLPGRHPIKTWTNGLFAIAQAHVESLIGTGLVCPCPRARERLLTGRQVWWGGGGGNATSALPLLHPYLLCGLRSCLALGRRPAGCCCGPALCECFYFLSSWRSRSRNILLLGLQGTSKSNLLKATMKLLDRLKKI